ncbi:MAG: NnrU family protein [Halofilum sp. (in: g-proteobacteria)]|nr:NnrU family protein [Halofilum sp. (in: g-proteobacteria)]
MSVLVVGLLLFLGVHSTSIIAPRWRDRMVARLGEGAWKGLYGAASLVGLVLVIWGYGLARQEPVLLYVPPAGVRHLGLLLLLFVFPLLLATYLPGKIRQRLKHPMLVAVKLWAVAHLLMNGMLADVVLFGAFLGWAVIDRVSLKHRPQREMLASAPPSRYNDAIAVVAGLALYAAFVFGLHRWLIGVPVVA